MITPIIMEGTMEMVRERVGVLRAKHEKRVHIDIGDGLFSDLLTIAPADLQELDLAGMEIDMHLMVDDPTEWIEESIALKPARLIAQIERMGSQQAFLKMVESYGGEGGLALALNTPIEEIEDESLNSCKTILLLAIPTGTTGEPFDERVLTKISSLRKIYQGNILIDGGINRETYKKIISAGATEAGANSAYWKNKL